MLNLLNRKWLMVLIVLWLLLGIGLFIVQKGWIGQPEIKNLNIPQKAASYIREQYPSYQIVSMTDDPMCTWEAAIDIGLQKSSEKVSLIFSPEWDYIQKEVDVDYSEASPKIQTKLQSEFARYTPSQQIEKLTRKNGDLLYLVDITQGSETREVIFDTGANIVCNK